MKEFFVLFALDPTGGFTITFHSKLADCEELASKVPEGWSTEIEKHSNIDVALASIESRVGELRRKTDAAAL